MPLEYAREFDTLGRILAVRENTFFSGLLWAVLFIQNTPGQRGIEVTTIYVIDDDLQARKSVSVFVESIGHQPSRSLR